MMRIQFIVGSIREGRRSRPIADWAYQLVSKTDRAAVDLVDLRDWKLPPFSLPKPPSWGNYENPLQQRWANTIAEADGYLFVSPEYNHGYTSALKNALDYIYAEWARKPASFISYGGVGGARGIEQLRLVLIELRMAPLRDALHIQQIKDKFKNDRFVGDANDGKQLAKVFDELVWWASALRNAREPTVSG
jgi:NAD(P)H-dependent FMN reductase